MQAERWWQAAFILGALAALAAWFAVAPPASWRAIPRLALALAGAGLACWAAAAVLRGRSRGRAQ